MSTKLKAFLILFLLVLVNNQEFLTSFAKYSQNYAAISGPVSLPSISNYFSNNNELTITLW
jgi:hypothetical protein